MPAAVVLDEPSSRVGKLFLALLAVFFFLMLAIPTSYQAERAILLAVLTLGAIIYALRGRWVVHTSILAWTLATTTGGLLFMWNGALHAAPGALRVGTVHVVWPLLYLLFIGTCRKQAALIWLEKTLIVGALASALMGIALVAATILGLGDTVAGLLASQEAGVGIYDGFVEYRLTNIPTMIFGVGFILALLSLPKEKRWCSGPWTFIAWVTLLASLVAVVLSGRRAAWLVVLLAPVTILGLMAVSRQRFTVFPWVVLAGMSALLFLLISQHVDLEFSSLVRQFLSAFDFSAEESASIRGVQAEALLRGWIERPIIGHGLGAGAHEVIRSDNQTWAYELAYVALLFQTGVIGVLLFGSAVLWIFWTGIGLARQYAGAAGTILPLLAGAAGFLVANATNPYISKFDYLWVIFLPAAAINVYLISGRSRTG